MTDDAVTYLIDTTSKVVSQLSERFSGTQLKIVRTIENKNTSYKLYAASFIGNMMLYDYFISDLDPITAYKFFQTDKMLEMEQKSFEQVRDALLREVS